MSVQVAAAPYAVHHKLWLPEGTELVGDPELGTGALLGKQWEPRALAKVFREEGWTDALALVTALCVCLAESQGYDHAIHVNLDGTRDRGVWQLNSIHADITDEIAYDVVMATQKARILYEADDHNFRDWAAFTTDVYLHDSYAGRAVRGVGNHLGELILDRPVKDWNGQPYAHRFVTPILGFRHQTEGVLGHVGSARKLLGWQAVGKAVVDAVQTELGRAQTAAKQALPN